MQFPVIRTAPGQSAAEANRQTLQPDAPSRETSMSRCPLLSRTLCLALGLTLAGLFPAASRAAGFWPDVLILNSYHQGEAWSDQEIDGIMLGLHRAHPDRVPSIEHLDAKRFPGPSHLDRKSVV